MNEVMKVNIDHVTKAVDALITKGDLSKMTPEERVMYYTQTCSSMRLNPLTRPFEYISLNGKLTLYAAKNCAEQLRKVYGVSLSIVDRKTIGDCYVVTAKAMLPDGRVDESTGAVAIGSMKGDTLCNALMKAETKAKRRVTLSICGMGMLDETELETVKEARRHAASFDQKEILERAQEQVQEFLYPIPPKGLPEEQRTIILEAIEKAGAKVDKVRGLIVSSIAIDELENLVIDDVIAA